MLLHKASRKRPLAIARLNGTLTKKYFFFPNWQRTDDNFWVEVVNVAARAANIAQVVVPVGYAIDNLSAAALAAKAGFDVRHEGSFLGNMRVKKVSNRGATDDKHGAILIEAHGSIRHFLKRQQRRNF